MNNNNIFEKMEIAENTEKLPKVPCVYLLFDNWCLEYIGQTSNLKKRMVNHKSLKHTVGMHSSKRYNKILYLLCKNKDRRIEIEDNLTFDYEPMYNHFSPIYV